jgi:hypothetical protein
MLAMPGVPNVSGFPLVVQWVVGAAIVCLYASDRFNDPLRIRAMTTFERYWLAWLGYVVAMLALFVLLGGGISVVDPALVLGGLGVDKSETAGTPPGPLLSALVLTSLLPHLPVLKKIDATVKSWFQRVGNIPYEVRELSARLRAATYEQTQEDLDLLKPEIRTSALKPEWLSLTKESFKYQWAVVTLLYARVATWRDSRTYGGYTGENHAALSAIRARLDALNEFVDESILDEFDGASSARLTVYMRKQTARQLAELRGQLFDFIAGGILSAARSPAQRRRAIETMGFRGLPTTPLPLSAHDIVLVSGLVFVAMLFVPLMIRRFFDAQPLPGQMRVVIMVPIIYAVAIVLAIYPKSVWRYAMRQPHQPRPIAAYAVSGLGAVVAAFFVSLLFRFAFDMPGNVLQSLSAPGAFVQAWDTTVTRWPWLVMTFFITVSIAWAADNEGGERLTPTALRLTETVGLAALFGTLAWCVSQLLPPQSLGSAADQLTTQIRMIGTSSLVGAIIGGLVPHLYRRRSRLAAPQVPLSALEPA